MSERTTVTQMSQRIPTPGKSSVRPVVSVDGVVIAREDIAREAQNHPAPTPAGAYAEAARALVIRQLLLVEARRLKLVAEPLGDGEGRHETDEEALIREVISREVATPKPSEKDCRHYYDQNIQKFKSSDIYEAAHILFAANPRDRSARSRAEADAKAAIASLKERPDGFSQLAGAHSACSSGRDGGRLGQITRGQTTRELDKALATLDVGSISVSPVETKYGFHVLRLDNRVEGRQLPFEMVHERISLYLSEAVQRRALAQYIAILVGQAKVTGVDLEGASSSLVQ